MRRKSPSSGPQGSGKSREVYFELYPVGDSMKVSAIDSATGIEVSIVGPANLPQSELERVALNKLNYVMAQKADENQQTAPQSGKNGKGWVV